jgi:TonB family protein
LFKVDRNGNVLKAKVLKAKVLKSSNNKAVDNSALEALKKSEPLPKEFKGQNFDIQFTFDYNIKKQKSIFN